MSATTDDLSLYPPVARDVLNHTDSAKEIGSESLRSEILKSHAGDCACDTKAKDDCYPSAIRAIENQGTDAQREALHMIERDPTCVDTTTPTFFPNRLPCWCGTLIPLVLSPPLPMSILVVAAITIGSMRGVPSGAMVEECWGLPNG
ncbi:hypothetical protein HDU67_009069 [Dinochytrium kinnereticum]|nr:hypothetical protein HDU67_009069 [Dinochytrium kinnereticum]